LSNTAGQKLTALEGVTDVWITMMVPLKHPPGWALHKGTRTSVLMEIEEIVETVEGVLVKMVAVHLGDSMPLSMGVTTIVEDGTCNEVEGTVGERDGDDAETETDTIAVGVREGGEDEKVIDGNALKGLLTSCQSCPVGSALEKRMQKPWAARTTYRTRYLGPQEKLGTAPKGKHIEQMICRNHLFQLPCLPTEAPG
jgi:hypothetical protein